MCGHPSAKALIGAGVSFSHRQAETAISAFAAALADTAVGRFLVAAALFQHQ